MGIKAVFLDRDGTLNREVDYLHKVEDFAWCDGVLPGLMRFMRYGYKLFVVSNQSGIARGMYDLSDLKVLENHMIEQLSEWGITIERWSYCPHHPDIGGPCTCRKPENGLLEEIIAEYEVDRNASWMIGDQWRDLQAGEKSGLQTVGVFANDRSQLIAENGGVLVPDFLSAVRHILD